MKLRKSQSHECPIQIEDEISKVLKGPYREVFISRSWGQISRHRRSCIAFEGGLILTDKQTKRLAKILGVDCFIEPGAGVTLSITFHPALNPFGQP